MASPSYQARFFTLIYSLFCIKDLELRFVNFGGLGRDYPDSRPETSPPWNGTLAIHEPQGLDYIVCRLADLPSGLHFRKFSFTWNSEEAIKCMTILVEVCSHTLEYINVSSYIHGKSSLFAFTARPILVPSLRLNRGLAAGFTQSLRGDKTQGVGNLVAHAFPLIAHCGAQHHRV